MGDRVGGLLGPSGSKSGFLPYYGFGCKSVITAYYNSHRGDCVLRQIEVWRNRL